MMVRVGVETHASYTPSDKDILYHNPLGRIPEVYCLVGYPASESDTLSTNEVQVLSSLFK